MTIRNPFSVGRWVSGSGFFGRQALISELVHGRQSCDWIIGKRRVGKTSLLRQLELEINHAENNQFALFWDVQGSYDSEGLGESLRDAIEDSQDQYPEKWQAIGVDWRSDEGCIQSLKGLIKALSRNGVFMVLLVDEAEEFMSVGKLDPMLTSKLRKIFQSGHHIHTIISSTPRLEQFHKTVSTETSPLLHGFNSFYLGPFDSPTCRALLNQAFPEPDIQDAIIEKTGGDPFELQLFAKHFFEHRHFDDISLQLEANPSLIQVIDVNFELLSVDEQNIIKDVFCGKNDLAAFEASLDRAVISKLLRMGYLFQGPNQVLDVGSFYQRQWLSQKFDSSPTFHAQKTSDPHLADDHGHLVGSQIVTFYKFFLEVAQDRKRLVTTDGAFRVSAFDQTIYPDGNAINLVPDLRQMDPWEIAIHETAQLIRRFLTPQESWSLFRFFEMDEKGAQHYTENDFLDLMMVIAEEYALA